MTISSAASSLPYSNISAYDFNSSSVSPILITSGLVKSLANMTVAASLSFPVPLMSSDPILMILLTRVTFSFYF